MITVSPAPLKFPPFISASAWGTVMTALWDAVVKKRGAHKTKSGAVAPRLTNGEVITVLAAMQPPLYGIRSQAAPLWDQFAAAAYGWNPATGKLDATPARRDAWFPDLLLAPLWTELLSAAAVLDAQVPMQRPRLDFDGRWDDVVFQNIVKMTVENDGRITDTKTAHAAFKIPIPACKDGKMPRCKRAMKRWPFLCEEWERCEPIIVKDPITVVRDKASNGFQMLLLIGAIWIVLDNSKPRRRRAKANR